jgi:1-acyl-sn-glycerol-3-phosphate acyltransferase
MSGWEVRGRESIPRAGGLIVAANHISYWDPPVVGAAIPREAHYLAKQELFSVPILGPLIRSVNSIPIRRGGIDLSGLSRAIEVLEKGGVLLVFPEGSRMKDGALHPSRPGLGLMAVQTGAPVVPCYVSGTNRPRRWLLRRERLRVWFGPARRWQELADAGLPPGRMLYQAIGAAVMGEIATLKEAQERSASRGAA